MEYKIFPADSLLSVIPISVPLEGARQRPAFANLKVKLNVDFLEKHDLRGPGIYGMFCRGALVYIGIYTGCSGRTFAGTVLDRWAKHITYFAMRNPELSFSPSNIVKMKKSLAHGPCSEILDILTEAGCDVSRPRDFEHVLMNGRSCTFNKARFATENWELFKPGSEPAMTAGISFAYGRFSDDEAPRMKYGTSDAEQYAHVKKVWLQPREKLLINLYKPVCNHQTKTPGPAVGPREFERALREVMGLSPARLVA